MRNRQIKLSITFYKMEKMAYVGDDAASEKIVPATRRGPGLGLS
jgi:hypothetical protein